MSDNWEQVQNDLRNGVYGPWANIRRQIEDYYAENFPDEGLGSSDVNHIAYGWVNSGRLTPIQRMPTPQAPNMGDPMEDFATSIQDQRARAQEVDSPGTLELLKAYLGGDMQAGEQLKYITGLDPEMFLEQGRKMFAPIADPHMDQSGSDLYPPKWSSVTHPHFTTGQPCTCGFTAHLQKTTKTAGKLHDFLMNPKSRPDLQTPEGQAWLKLLEMVHNERTDAIMPWLTREWKKGRVLHHHGPQYDEFRLSHPDDPEGHWIEHRLGQGKFGHWVDFLHANHPVRQELGDIMKHDVWSYYDHVHRWDRAMEDEAQQKALEGGEVYHEMPDGWTIRRLRTPEELKGEGDAMGHCVGGYAPAVERGDSQIYSLRDPEGYPHTTIEIHPNETAHGPWNGPNQGKVVQIQGKANREPLDEYKARVADWFRSFPETYGGEHQRPTWEGEGPDWEDDPYLYDDQGYSHSSLDHPDLIPEWERKNGALERRTEPFEDSFGLLRDPQNIDADYDELLGNIKFHYYGQGSEPDSDHIKDIYRLAVARGEIPQLGQALEGYQGTQQDDFDDWMHQNYEYAPRYPDEPHGWEDSEGEEAKEGTPGARPYWEPTPMYGERYYDEAEAEKAYDQDYTNWQRQHAGMNAVSQMYQLINQHQVARQPDGSPSYTNDLKQPEQAQQVQAKIAKRLHKNPWGDPCSCPWSKPSHKEHVGHKEAAKIDWLRERPDVQQDPKKNFIVNHIFSHYPEESDTLLPWILREYSKGRLGFHGNLDWYFPELVGTEEAYQSLIDAGYDPSSIQARILQDKIDNLKDGMKNVASQGYGLTTPGGEHNPRYWVGPFAEMMDSLKRRGQGIDLMQHDFPSMLERHNAWRQEEERRKEEELRRNNGKVVHKWNEGPNKGWTVRRLTTPEECDLEGELMGHCVGSYGFDAERGNTNIYSLRDHKNEPHATMEVRRAGGNEDDPTLWKIPNHLWDELPMEKFKGVPIEDIRRYHDEYADRGVSATSEPWVRQAGSVYPAFMQKAVQAGTAIPPMDDSEVVQTQGKSNEPPLGEYTRMLDEFLAPHGVASSFNPWWDDYYEMEGPQSIHDLVGYNGDEGAFDLPGSDWYEPEEYQRAQAEAYEQGVDPPDLRVGAPDYHSILESIIDPSRGLRHPNPWEGYDHEVGEYVLENARNLDRYEQNYPESAPWNGRRRQEPAQHVQNLRQALEEHAKAHLPDIPPFEHDPLADRREIEDARRQHYAPYESDPWAQMYNHLGPQLGLAPTEGYLPPSQIHPDQMDLFKYHPPAYRDNGSIGYPDYSIAPRTPNAWADFPDPDVRQMGERYREWTTPEYNYYPLSKTASLYQRWVFSPATGQVELADNDGDPLQVKYHSDLARDLNESNLTHGYAYRIGDGWRLFGWDNAPIEDPYVIAQVMRRLQTQRPEVTPENGWEPIYDEDWDHSHHGIPGS